MFPLAGTGIDAVGDELLTPNAGTLLPDVPGMGIIDVPARPLFSEAVRFPFLPPINDGKRWKKRPEARLEIVPKAVDPINRRESAANIIELQSIVKMGNEYQ